MDDKGRYVWIEDEEYSYLPGNKRFTKSQFSLLDKSKVLKIIS